MGLLAKWVRGVRAAESSGRPGRDRPGLTEWGGGVDWSSGVRAWRPAPSSETRCGVGRILWVSLLAILRATLARLPTILPMFRAKAFCISVIFAAVVPETSRLACPVINAIASKSASFSSGLVGLSIHSLLEGSLLGHPTETANGNTWPLLLGIILHCSVIIQVRLGRHVQKLSTVFSTKNLKK